MNFHNRKMKKTYPGIIKFFSLLFCILLFSAFQTEKKRITVLAPGQGDKWEIGTTQKITWSFLDSNPRAQVTVSLLKGGAPLLVIAKSVPAKQAAVDWTIDKNIPPGEDYKIKIGVLGFPKSFGYSKGYFSIIEKKTPAALVQAKKFSRKKSSGRQYFSRFKPFEQDALKEILPKRETEPVFKSIGNPGHAPLPSSEDCSCEVFIWLDPEKPDNIYFDDESFTIHYSVDCATELGHYWDYLSTAEALYVAERGIITDGGTDGLNFPDADAAGVLSGSRTFPAGSGPGVYSWNVFAHNNDNPESDGCSERIAFQIIERPSMDDSCFDWVDCINDMMLHIIPLVSSGITNNLDLDAEVEAFSDNVYDRRTIGLRLELELETMAHGFNVVCTDCEGDSHYSESRPDEIVLDFCPPYYPTDYAVLHELTHKVGFDSRLIRAYIDAGLWDPAEPGTDLWDEYKSRVEHMTAIVSGTPFDRSRICTEY